MNFDEMARIMKYWNEEFNNKRELPTQFPNSKEAIDKSELWCEIINDNPVRTLIGFRTEQPSGDVCFCYDETGELTITLYSQRGEGEGDLMQMADCIKNLFTDVAIGNVEFHQARGPLPLTPVDEQWITQIICPYESSFEEKEKENIA